MKIILATHGDFCHGIKQSYEMLAGTNDSIIPVSLSSTDTGEFKKEIENLIGNDEYLILCDIFGGSPFNEVSKIALKNPDRIKVFSGLNLPILLECGVMEKAGFNIEKIVSAIKDVAANSCKQFDTSSDPQFEEDIF